MAILWAVYRQDFSGNRFTVGVNGVFKTPNGEEIQVWGLETEADANKACKRIYESHYHPHKADYFPVDYVDGCMKESFVNRNIQMMG